MHSTEFFRYNLEKEEVLMDVLKVALPEKYFNLIDFDKIESEDTDFITKNLWRKDDALFRVPLGGIEFLIYIHFERERVKASELGSTILDYFVKIFERELERVKGFTPILPVIIYNGKNDEKPSGEFFSEYGFKKEEDYLKKFFLNFTYFFLDLSKVDEIKLSEDATKIFLKVLRESVEYESNIVKNFLKITKAFRGAWAEDLLFAIRVYMIYIIRNSYDMDFDTFDTIEEIYKKVVSRKKGIKEMETMFKVLTEEAARKSFIEGREEGFDEGVVYGSKQGRKECAVEAAKYLIKLGLSFEDISAATGLILKEVEDLF